MMPASNKGVGMNLGFPDVCLTPAAPAPVPIPYPNMGMNAMAVPFAPNVMISMMPGLNMSSRIPMTMGDEGGVSHPLFKQMGGYTMGNPMIYINSLPAINLLLPTTGNNYNNPLGAATVPSIVNVFFTSVAGTALPSGAPGTDRFTRAVDRAAIEQLEMLLEQPAAAAPGLSWSRTLGPSDPDDRRLVVAHVRRNSMAAGMGLRPRDELLAIHGRPVADMMPHDLESALSPEPGRVVDITVRRADGGKPVTLSGARTDAPCGTVRGRLLAGAVGYLEIDVFAPSTPTTVGNTIRRLEAAGMRALVLDLRCNPGGDADAALRIADAFVDRGSPLSRTRDNDGDETVQRARQPGAHDFPVVVLVDGSTASAAEVLAGALRHAGRATIVGERTYGKGAVQQLIPDPAGEGVLLATIASFMLPAGTPIEGRGVAPDLEVAGGTASPGRPFDDAQLRAAVEAAVERISD